MMGLRHVTLPLEGVQFHPESVLTPEGPRLLANFLRQAGEGEAGRLDAVSGSFATGGMARPTRPRAWPADERARPGGPGRRRRRPGADDGRGPRRDGRGDGRRGHPGPAGRPARRPPDARRDDGRAGGLRHGDAGAGPPGRSRRRARSTSSGPAAIGAARSTSRRRRPSSSPRPGCPWPSTATGRSRRARARPTCSMPWASGPTMTRVSAAAALRHDGFAFLFATGLPPRDEVRRPDPSRDRGPDGVQPDRPADQPGRRARLIVGVGDEAAAPRIAEVLRAARPGAGPRRPRGGRRRAARSTALA